MNVERVQELRRMLVHIRDSPLYDVNGHPIMWNLAIFHMSDTCGTSACALGHMPYWEPFAGDKWCAVGGNITQYDETKGFKRYDFDAAQHYFGITLDQADGLFAGWYPSIRDATVEDVIDKVDRLLDDPDYDGPSREDDDSRNDDHFDGDMFDE